MYPRGVSGDVADAAPLRPPPPGSEDITTY
jgi:hypothetical protein